jgi:cytidine deaminase
MRKIIIEPTIFEIENDKIEAKYTLLISKSMDATKLSYSPYSEFKVGCAILLDNGEIILGANQENASYPICICAEGITLGAVSTQFPSQKIIAVAIHVSNLEVPVSPCGLCRQSFLEYEKRMGTSFEYFLVGKKHTFYFKGIENILPLAFKEL